MRTGSLVNNIKSYNSTEPQLDQGATILMHSDRHGATIVAIRRYASGAKKGQPSEVIVREDTAKIISGSAQDGSAVYEHSYNDNGAEFIFTRDSQGGWKSKGGGAYLSIGSRDTYYDPSF